MKINKRDKVKEGKKKGTEEKISEGIMEMVIRTKMKLIVPQPWQDVD